MKVNPLANWTDDDVASYIETHDVPVNPLLLRGYGSIGCQPCTQPGDARAGPLGRPLQDRVRPPRVSHRR